MLTQALRAYEYRTTGCVRKPTFYQKQVSTLQAPEKLCERRTPSSKYQASDAVEVLSVKLNIVQKSSFPPNLRREMSRQRLTRHAFWQAHRGR